MPAGSETFAGGGVSITYNSTAVGLLVGGQNGPTLEQVGPHVEEVRDTIAYGKSLIDAQYSGVDFFLSMHMMEWKAGSLAPLWPFGTVGLLGVIGRSLYDLSQALVMTAIANTPEAANGYATLTASKAILAPNNNVRLLFSVPIRTIPLRMALLPYDTGTTTYGHFTTT